MIYFFIIAVCVTLTDQITKFYLLQYVYSNGIQNRQYISSGNHIIDITFATNTGAAFSLLPNRQNLFIAITIIALAGILIYLLKYRVNERLQLTGLALIFGGAIGNLTDRLLHGKVIDFIDVHWNEAYHWPTFNMADSSICIGVTLLFVHLFLKEIHKPQPVTQNIPDITIEPESSHDKILK